MTDAEGINRTIVGVERLVTIIAQNEGYNNFKLDIKTISTKGANYLGDLYAADVVETGKDTLKLFAKATNTPKNARGILDAGKFYKREVFMYSTIADVFHKLQEKHNVPKDKQFIFPKYYGSHLEDCKEVLVLENLAAQDFESHDRFKPVNWTYAKAAIEEIAKFHTLSFALEKEDHELYNKLIKNNENLMRDDFEKFTDSTIPHFLPLAIDFVEPEHRQKIEAYFEIHKHGIFKDHYVPISKHSVLVHGDYKISNILVKYKGNAVAALKPCDYQTLFYGCPLNDVIFFLISGTDAEFRRLHFERIIEHYHDSLAAHLQLMSHDINDIYPKSTFYFELKDKIMFGLEVAFFQLNIVLLDSDISMKLEDFADEEKVKENIGKIPAVSASNRIYKERMNGIVRDYVRWGLL